MNESEIALKIVEIAKSFTHNLSELEGNVKIVSDIYAKVKEISK